MIKNEQAFGCVGNTIRLRSGKYLDLRDPKTDQFSLEDIAGALSKICRFGGQCDTFYSVAEHSILCAEVGRADGLDAHLQRSLLMHDAAEAFIGDMVKPLKIMVPEYAVVEQRMEAAIAEKFGIDFVGTAKWVSKIDHEILIAERRHLFSTDKAEWAGENQVRKLDVKIRCWYPTNAEQRFLDEAGMLGVK